MGNTGSIHNLHTEGVSDLNSYYRTARNRGRKIAVTHKYHQGLNESPTLLRNREANNSTINDGWSNSFPRPKHHGSSTESPVPHVKVLPKLNENLQLRSTANGAILQSGGTITGRREQHNLTPDLKKVLPLPPSGLMQRSHTLIYDRSEAHRHNIFRSSNGSPLAAAPVFRRVQTQLNMKYNHSEQNSDLLNDKPAKITPTLSEPNLRLEHNGPVSYKLNSSSQIIKQDNVGNTNKITKVNKYNKKRKAPAVPSTAGTSNELKPKHLSNAPAYRTDDKNNSSNKTQIATNLAASAALAHEAKARLFRTKAETELSNAAGQRGKHNVLGASLSQPQKQKIPQTQRSNVLYTSIKRGNTGSPQQQQRQPLLPYRREKSFDATLLRGREQAIQEQDIPKHATTLQRLPKVSIDAPKATKIPQLKRTFYFGMEARRSSGSEVDKKKVEDMQNDRKTAPNSIGKKTINTSTTKTLPRVKTEVSERDNNELDTAERSQEEDSNTSSSSSLTPVYDIGTGSKIYMDDSDDNGLQVHVRPTLPKRQLDIPRFSPAAAWRFLTEKQQQMQLQRGTTKVTRTTQKQTSAAAAAMSQKVPVTNTTDVRSDVDNALLDNSEKLPQKEAPIQPKCNATSLLLNTKQQHAATKPNVVSDQHQESTIKTYLAAWTPQQDLEEDDSSSDELPITQSKLKGGVDEHTFMFGADGESSAKPNLTQSSFGCASVHVFSLSLPREGNDMKSATTFNDKLQKSGFSSLQKLKQTVSGGNCGCIQSKYNDSNIMDHVFSSGTVTDHPLTTAAVITDATGTELTSGIQSSSYRSDNWVLGKTKLGFTSNQTAFGTGGNEDLQPVSVKATDKARWDSLASMEPISLSHLTAGKHVMYLPNESNEQIAVNSRKPKIEQKSHEKIRKKREMHTRESLQDVPPAELTPATSTTVTVSKQSRDTISTTIVSLLEKPQRFSFQSTVRLIEKRRLAEKLSKDAEIKEAQRRSELEAMKRVEEDFQRKRAFEKASIRQQLRLVSNMENMEQYHSLPAVTTDFPRTKTIQEDSNNNINYRADPDGAASSPSSSPLMHSVQDTERFVLSRTTDDIGSPETLSHPVTARFYNHADRDRERQREQSLYRGRDSINELDIDMLEFQRTASLVKPYLQSIVK